MKLINIKSNIDAMSLKKAAMLVFAFALIVNLALAAMVGFFLEPVIGTGEYIAMAENLSLGNDMVMAPGEAPALWRPPFYIYLLAGFFLLFSSPYFAVVAFQALLNAGTGAVAFFIGDRVFGRQTGFWAALLLSLYPLFTYNVLRMMPETLYAFFLSLIVMSTMYIHEGRGGWKLYGLLGLLLGLASLTKASIQFYPLYLFVLTFVFVNRGSGLALALGRWLSVIAVMVLVILPWTLRNYSVSGEFILIDTSGGYTFWVGNRLQTDGLDDDPLTRHEFIEIEKDIARIVGEPHTEGFDLIQTAWGSARNSGKLYRAGISGMIAEPGGTLLLWVKKLYRFWFAYIGRSPGVQAAIAVLQALLLTPALLGLYFCIKNKRQAFAMFSVLSYFMLLHMAAVANARYSVPVLPYVFMFAIYGIGRIFNKNKAKAEPD